MSQSILEEVRAKLDDLQMKVEERRGTPLPEPRLPVSPWGKCWTNLSGKLHCYWKIQLKYLAMSGAVSCEPDHECLKGEGKFNHKLFEVNKEGNCA